MKGILNRISNTKIFSVRGGTIKFFRVKLSSKYLFKIGAGVPSGTPDAFIYVNRSGTTANTIFYGDVNGTWTAWTVS